MRLAAATLDPESLDPEKNCRGGETRSPLEVRRPALRVCTVTIRTPGLVSMPHLPKGNRKLPPPETTHFPGVVVRIKGTGCSRRPFWKALVLTVC